MVRYAKPAILDPDQIGSSHCAIEASAGTGKTYTLEHLIIQLILEGVPLEKILVVTFTRKATLELMARVREKLAELASLSADKIREGHPFWELTPERVVLLVDALMGFDRATISTIHGFCQQVLQDAAFEGGRLFQQEAVASEDAFDRAFTTLLRTDYSTRQKSLLAVALGTQGGVTGLRKLLQAAFKEAEGLDLPAFKDARSFLEAFPADLAQAFLDKRGSVRDGFPEGHTAIGNCLKAILERRDQSLVSDSPELFWADSEWLDKRLAALDKICLEGLEGDSATLSRAVAELVNFKAILVAAFLPPLREELLRYKTEEGLYDFDDMITLVAETLESPQGEGLVKRLRERFQVALIDEFQDTDHKQWGIFSKVFLDSPEGHRLFLVGDPKQAIYGFRGGDLPTYVSALKAITDQTGREPLSLDENFRSTQGVIQAYNAILQESDDVPFFSGANARHYQHPVTCGKPALRLTDAHGQDLPAIRVVDVPVGKEKARHTKLQAARVLAAALKETLATGRFGAPGDDQPELRCEDVFVLTQTLKEGKPIAQALKEVGIPSALYRQNGLFDGPEAEACRDILLAVEAPFDECRRAKALLGPFFGLSFAEAERARELPEGHPILTLLFGLRELAQQGRFGELFNRLISESGLSQRLLFLDESQRALTNLLHILELLQQEALGGHCTLADLAIQAQRWIDGQDRPSVEDSETQRLERQGGAVQILTMHKAKGRQGGAVQILTMHKAKGLQAPIVVLFGGTAKRKGGLIHRYHRGGQGERRAWLGSVKAAPAEVQGWISKEEQEEWERLAYVALTRAEAQLLLPRYIPGDDPPAPSGSFDATGNPKDALYRTLNLRLQALLGPAEAPRSQAGIERIPHNGERSSEANLPPEPWAVHLPSPLTPPDFQTLRQRGCPTWMFSYSGLQHGFERIGAEEVIFEETKEPTLPGGPTGGKKFGTQVHALLQRVVKESFKDVDLPTWMALPGTVASAEQAHLPAEGRADALRWAYQAMTLPIPLPNGETAALAEAEEWLREMDFMTPYPERADFLSGSIDLLFQTGGRTHVLDWKTNRLPDYDPAHLEATVQGHYLLQVKIYTLTTCRFLGIRDLTHYERAFGGIVYVFLRGLPEGGIWTCRPSWEEVQEWQRDLVALQPERLIPAHAGGERYVG